MGFLGFYSSTRAVIEIFDKYVKPDNSQLPYLLTYKFSQDHLELFFSAIRARGGWCPNPTCTQFSSVYKRLLIHHEIASNGNVEIQDNTTILTVSSSAQRMKRLDTYDPAVYNKIANLRVCKKYQLDDESFDQSFINAASSDMLPETMSDFCGFVIRKIWTRIKCESCRKFLINMNFDNNINNNYSNVSIDDTTNLSYQNAIQLIFEKRRDNFIPSEAIYKITQLTEQMFRRAINCNEGRLPNEPQFGAMLCLKVLRELLSNSRTICNMFPDLNSHVFDDTVEELPYHTYTLIKSIIIEYIEVRMFSHSKICSLRQTGINLRHYMNRQLIWKHQ